MLLFCLVLVLSLFCEPATKFQVFKVIVCFAIIRCSVQDYDSGSYFCRASNIHLQRFLTSRKATLTVLGMTLHQSPDTVTLETQTIASSMCIITALSHNRCSDPFLLLTAPPSVKLWPQVLTVPVGAQVVLECLVSGHPLPSISWIKRGHSKQTGGKIILG